LDIKSLHIIAYGIVQGVGFRYYTKLQADKYDVFGTVMNKKDGTVEIYAEGEQSQLIKFLDWCHEGPSSANVERIEYTYQEIKGYSEFKIIR